MTLLWVPLKILLLIILFAILIISAGLFALGIFNSKSRKEVEEESGDKKEHASEGLDEIEEVPEGSEKAGPDAGHP